MRAWLMSGAFGAIGLKIAPGPIQLPQGMIEQGNKTMKLKTFVLPGMAICSMIAAQPAWAQSNGPASGSVDAIASIEGTSPTLEIETFNPLNFGSVVRPNGIVSGAQCRYTLTPNTSRSADPSVAEIRNGQVFDFIDPTESGCQFTGIEADVPSFTVICTASTPVTIRAEWASQGRQGVTLTGNSNGIVERSTGNMTSVFSVDLSGNSVVVCSENDNPAFHRFIVAVGGTLTVDANAAISSNDKVGSVTLIAMY